MANGMVFQHVQDRFYCIQYVRMIIYLCDILVYDGHKPSRMSDTDLSVSFPHCTSHVSIFQNEYIPATYYYAALNDSEFSFAFSLSDTDRVRDTSWLLESVC